MQSGHLERARRVAAGLRARHITVDDAPGDVAASFRGSTQSDNGREWGQDGFEEFLEITAVLGYQPA